MYDLVHRFSIGIDPISLCGAALHPAGLRIEERGVRRARGVRARVAESLCGRRAARDTISNETYDNAAIFTRPNHRAHANRPHARPPTPSFGSLLRPRILPSASCSGSGGFRLGLVEEEREMRGTDAALLVGPGCRLVRRLPGRSGLLRLLPFSAMDKIVTSDFKLS